MRLTKKQLGRRLFAVATALVAVGASATFVMHADAAVPPPPSGMSLVFSDDFTGAAGTGTEGLSPTTERESP